MSRETFTFYRGARIVTKGAPRPVARASSGAPSGKVSRAKPIGKLVMHYQQTVPPTPPVSARAARERDDYIKRRDGWYAQHEAGMDRRRFWVVWCPTERRPSMRHATLELALATAERLSKAAPTKEFLVYGCELLGGEGPLESTRGA
jgi:hypothetical protein